MNTVTVIIAWYGDDKYWQPFLERSVASVLRQTVKADNLIVKKGMDLISTRNEAAMESATDYILFLDADDSLDEGYIEEMKKGSGDIRVPSVHRYYEQGYGGVDKDQRWYTPVELIRGQNYIVVAALVDRWKFIKVGGFRNLTSLDDYDLWLRMEEAGADIRQCPDAIYNLYVRENSRSVDQNKILNQIVTEAKQRRGLI